MRERNFVSGFVASMACSMFPPVSASPRSPAFQGKWPHVPDFHRRVHCFKFDVFLLPNVVSINISVSERLQMDRCAFFNSCFSGLHRLKSVFKFIPKLFLNGIFGIKQTFFSLSLAAASQTECIVF